MKLFKPYFAEWLVRQYFAGWWLLIVLTAGIWIAL